MSTTAAHESLAILDKQISQMTEALCALKRRRNALLPVNRIPDELLEEIIVAAHTLEVSRHQNTVPKTLRALLLVCSCWHAVVQSSRQPWALVDLAYRDISCMFAQSGDYPRTVWGGGFNLHSRHFDALKSLAPSLRTLQLDYTLRIPEPAIVRCLRQSAFTNLTRAELVSVIDGPLARPSAGETFLPMPRLRHLILHAVHPSYLEPWDFPELTRLAIASVLLEEDLTPFLPQVGAGCTALKNLVLHAVGIQLRTGPRIRYPHLERLRFSSIHPHHIYTLLDCLDVPSSCSFEFMVIDAEAELAWPEPPFASLLRRHKPAITTVCFDINPTGVVLHAFENSCDYACVSIQRKFSKPWQCWGDIASVARQMWKNMPLESLRYAWVDMPRRGDMAVSTVTKKTRKNTDLATAIVNRGSKERRRDEGVSWEVSKIMDLLLDAVPERHRQNVHETALRQSGTDIEHG